MNTIHHYIGGLAAYSSLMTGTVISTIYASQQFQQGDKLEAVYSGIVATAFGFGAMVIRRKYQQRFIENLAKDPQASRSSQASIDEIVN